MPRKSDAVKTGVTVKHATQRPIARSTTAISFVTDDDLIEEAREKEGDEREPTGDSGIEDMGVLSILRDYQKRKSREEAARSAALRLQKNALFAETRRKGNNLVKFGSKHIEDARSTIAVMKTKEQTYETQLNDLTPLLEASDKSLQALLSFYASAIDDLFQRRVHKIDQASAMREHPLVRLAVA